MRIIDVLIEYLIPKRVSKLSPIEMLYRADNQSKFISLYLKNFTWLKFKTKPLLYYDRKPNIE